MNEVVEFLQNRIPLRVLKSKTYVFVSRKCPICGYESKKSNVFRYHAKKKVGKCFCCGNAFKSLYWLKLLLYNPIKAELIRIDHDPFLTTPQKREYARRRILDGKNNPPYSNFKKCEDESLPF
jgi:hypothetical protein